MTTRLTSILCLLAIAAAAGVAAAPASPEWLRYPSISPDGKTIVFTYKGDLYRVPAAGGTAAPLTLHEAHDFMPVWSHDGKWVAFASDRFGNFDVFVMPAEGGEVRRLTYHSAAEYPYAFSNDDTVDPVRRRAPGQRREPAVPDRLAARAVPGAGRRRTRRAGADDAGRGREGQPQRPVPPVPRQEGRRERVAQAPHVGDRAGHLALRHAGRARTGS